MNIKKVSKIIALALALLLLSGCGLPGNIGSNGNEATAVEYEYAFYDQGIACYQLGVSNDSIYIRRSDFSSGNPSFWIEVYDRELNHLRRVDYESYIEESYIIHDGFAVTPDGGYWIIERSIWADVNDKYLRYFDSGGNEQFTVDLNKAYGDGLSLFGTDKGGCAFLSSADPFEPNPTSLLLVDQNGEIAARWEGIFHSALSLATLDDGRIIALQWGGGGSIDVCEIYELTYDGEAKLLHTLDDKAYGRLWAGEGDTVYIGENQSLYRMSLDTLKLELILNWSKEAPGMQIDELVALGEDKLITPWYNRVFSIERVADHDKEVDDRGVIQVAAYMPDEIFRTAIYDFNISSRTHRMEVIDYSQYDKEGEIGAVLCLNMDIAAGRIPDLYLWGLHANHSGFDLTRYLNIGLFADMGEFLDKDSELSRESFVPSILNAVISSDGGLYELPIEFYMRVVTCDRSTIELEKWTFDEFYREIEQHTGETNIFGTSMTQDILLYLILSNNWDEYIDWQTGKCDFESDSFLKLLELCAAQNSEWTPGLESDAIADVSQLLVYNTLSDVSSIQRFKALFQDEITFIGFPTAEGRGNAVMLNKSVSIHDNSPHKDICWEFVKTFYDKEYQLEYLTSFPTNAEDMEERLTRPEDFEETGASITNTNIETGETWTVTFTDATEGESAQVRELIESLDRLYRSNESLYNIILEDAVPYFAGDKTAAETARIIQSRASIYLAEQR